MNKIDDLENAIVRFNEESNIKSTNILLIDFISQANIKYHKSKYLKLDNNEKPLLILNARKTLFMNIMPFTGFVLTNKKLHFATMKRSFFSSLVPIKERPRSFLLENIDSFQIGEHDSCLGTAYIGHDLMVNSIKQGLIRLGMTMFYDRNALNYINGLSKYLFENGFLKDGPKTYRWQ